jgi:ribosomal protein S12 methylthiotransferase accessory factor
MTERDIKQAVDECIARLGDAGLEVVVVDKSRPDIPLDTVHVVVPGLRHFWPRFGPGRLYEVPCRMGWLKEARTEEMVDQLPLWL